MEDIIQLADLIKKRNLIEQDISVITNRPAMLGHTGEYIASRIFNIKLQESASNKGIDGYFTDGNLAGKSVNIKWYTRQQSLLDITPDYLPDYYLVLTGAKVNAASSKGTVCPWEIKHVYLFDAAELVEKLVKRGVKIGIATSIKKESWESAEIYPVQKNLSLPVSDSQRQLLSLFRFMETSNMSECIGK